MEGSVAHLLFLLAQLVIQSIHLRLLPLFHQRHVLRVAHLLAEVRQLALQGRLFLHQKQGDSDSLETQN